ncbi:chemotaxis protein CheW [Natronosalvus halobius]|uniref:chemotaxis protein CheW n=1 Tax=Natronosalvus halobius TaxID=2953746 RepID=UPI00209D2629|nr:chemotaxis protein CheW [Natronosalvus halobius]USZ70739.1 chemotaxis protein CheW [Natronosalvus halobius]
MAPELPDRLLGISIEDPSERQTTDETKAKEEERVRFIFVRLGDHRLAIPVDEVKTVTDPPADTNLTRVPRSPAAVEGLVDLRGEITAIVDPRVHFPVGPAPAAQRLVVLDRPTDQQSAALRVDEVLGVHNIAEDDVLEPDEVEDPGVAGGVIEHPLVCGLVERERRPRQESRTRRRDRSSRFSRSRSKSGSASASPSSTGRISRRGSAGSGADAGVDADETVVSDEFVLEDEDADEASRTPSRTEATIVIEATGILDVPALLLAAGAEA